MATLTFGSHGAGRVERDADAALDASAVTYFSSAGTDRPIRNAGRPEVDCRCWSAVAPGCRGVDGVVRLLPTSSGWAVGRGRRVCFPVTATLGPVIIPTRGALPLRGRRLECATLGCNVIRVVVVLAVAALGARSVALAGFGLDSLIEIGASTVVLWQLSGSAKPGRREHRAMRLIGVGFVLLVVYLGVQTLVVFCTGGRPSPSPLGIGWTALTFVVMLALAAAKGRTGAELGNPVLTAEGRVTLIDAWLSGSVLLGLVLNAVLGWWWADPVAGLVIVYYGIREAHAAWTHSDGAGGS